MEENTENGVLTGEESATRELAEFVAAHPEAAAKCDWSKFDGGDWSLLLRAQPQLADKCDWSQLPSYNWAALLSEKPEFAAMCCDSVWKRMDGHAIAYLISAQPVFADKFDFSRFGGRLLSRILRHQPQLADKCDFSRLNGENWTLLLSDRPQFADRCDWAKLGTKTALWRYLLRARPKFADKCPWASFSPAEVAGLIAAQPAAARAAKAALKAGGRPQDIATVGWPLIDGTEYRLSVHGTETGDCQVPHVHLDRVDDTERREFAFEISLVDLLATGEPALLRQTDVRAGIRRTGPECSWAGYERLRDGILEYLDAGPEWCAPRRSRSNLESAVIAWNKERGPYPNALADYLRERGIGVLDKYKTFFQRSDRP